MLIISNKTTNKNTCVLASVMMINNINDPVIFNPGKNRFKKSFKISFSPL